ncbi:transcription antitermination factor NusB, partial [uncultured Catenibacterium sp.]
MWHAILIRIPHINMKERDTALDILIDYEKNESYLNITLNHTLTQDFSPSERGLITTLVYGTIQNRLYLEYQLEPHIHTRLKVVERMLLLMSLYQHFYLDTPDYAIVNEAVEIIKERRNKRAGGMINAILHSCFKETRSLDDLDHDERLSISTSHPLWMVKMFNAQYGKETTEKILHADNEVPLKSGRV